MAEVKKSSVVKKKWYTILAPKLFNEMPVGETCALNPNSLMGRVVIINVGAALNDMKKQNTNLKCVITGVKDDRATTAIKGYFLMPSHIKRLSRRSRSRVDLSFVCVTSDNKSIRIKPMILALRAIKRSASSALNKTCTTALKEEIKKAKFEDVIEMIISY